jgi:hypothetical protein
MYVVVIHLLVIVKRLTRKTKRKNVPRKTKLALHKIAVLMTKNVLTSEKRNVVMIEKRILKQNENQFVPILVESAINK